MSGPVVIPWPSGASWRQSVTLSGEVFKIIANWNEIGEFWNVSILNRDDVPLTRSVKLVVGALHLAGLADRRLPRGYFVVVNNGQCGCTPGRDDMGVNAELNYVPAI